MLIETEVLLASINPRDPLGTYARKVFDQESVLLSPFSLLELHLLIRAKKLEVDNLQPFAEDLSALLAAKEVKILADKPEYHAQASVLESRFRLGFFDSLHAAVAKVEAEAIGSFDKSYDRLRAAGVKRLDPREL